MPGPLLTVNAVVTCTHAGPATAMPPTGRVSVMGMAVVTLAHTYTITGCAFPAATSGAPPCVSGKLTVGALRVKSMGMPVGIVPSVSTCIPNATPMILTPGQVRVQAS
jgi:hypothetical protein